MQTTDSRDNAIGLLRLVLALAVLVGHVPELADGDRAREPLTALLGGLSIGEWAVDSFFFLSGWLLTASLQRGTSTRAYLVNRAARIYPGFLAAFLLCLLVVAPLAGVAFSAVRAGWTDAIVWAAFLAQPAPPGVFATLPYPGLNGSLWTLGFEARCYLLLLLLSRVGLLDRPRIVAALALAGLLIAGLAPSLLDIHGGALWIWITMVEPHGAARLAGVFLAGGAFYLLRARLRYTRAAVIVAAALLIAGLSSRTFGHLAAATAGGYLLLGFAYHPPRAWMNRIGRRRDLSYGVYLYAWPITNLLLYRAPGLPLIAVGALTVTGALMMAWLSWTLIEAPAIRLARPRRPTPAPPVIEEQVSPDAKAAGLIAAAT